MILIFSHQIIEFQTIKRNIVDFIKCDDDYDKNTIDFINNNL